MVPDFDRLAALHRRANLFYGAVAAVLLCLGLGLLWGGPVAGRLPSLPATAVGLVALSLITLPIARILERRERIAGLAVLHEEWLASDEDADRAQLAGMVADMYGARR